MAMTTLFMLVIFPICIYSIIALKLYKTISEDREDCLKELSQRIIEIKQEVASYRLSIDGKIERAIIASKSNRRKRRLVKDEKKDEKVNTQANGDCS